MGSGCSTGPTKLCRGTTGSASARQRSAGGKYVEGNSGVSLLNMRFSFPNAYMFGSLELKSYLSGLQKSRMGRVISGCHMWYGMALWGASRVGDIRLRDHW